MPSRNLSKIEELVREIRAAGDVVAQLNKADDLADTISEQLASPHTEDGRLVASLLASQLRGIAHYLAPAAEQIRAAQALAALPDVSNRPVANAIHHAWFDAVWTGGQRGYSPLPRP